MCSKAVSGRTHFSCQRNILIHEIPSNVQVIYLKGKPFKLNLRLCKLNVNYLLLLPSHEMGKKYWWWDFWSLWNTANWYKISIHLQVKVLVLLFQEELELTGWRVCTGEIGATVFSAVIESHWFAVTWLKCCNVNIVKIDPWKYNVIFDPFIYMYHRKKTHFSL